VSDTPNKASHDRLKGYATMDSLRIVVTVVFHSGRRPQQSLGKQAPECYIKPRSVAVR